MKAASDSEPARHVESTPLMRARERSIFALTDDTHFLTKPAKPAGSSSASGAEAKRHLRLLSDWTLMSSGRNHRARRAARLRTKLFIAACYGLVFLYTCTILVGPLLLAFQDKAEWCSGYNEDEEGYQRKLTADDSPLFASDVDLADKEFKNPDYCTDPCQYIRLPNLVGLTLEECDMSRRMLTSVILGGAIGYVRGFL